MTLCKNDVIEATIESLGYRGEGVARIGRIPVFINGALPGENVRALIISVKKDFCVGKLLEVIIPSIERVEPKCQYFGKCGGCNLQHLDYACQLEYKKEQIKDNLKKIASLDKEVDGIFGCCKEYGYRNKMSLPVRLSNGKTAVGLYAYNSHRVVEIDSCPLQSDATNALIPTLKRIARQFVPFDEENNRGELKHIIVREINGKISLTFVVRKDVSKKLKSVLENYDDIADEIWMNENPENTNVILGKKFSLIQGEIIKERVYGYETVIHPAGFLQVNTEIAAKLYKKVIDLVEIVKPKTIIDAYCGGGMLTAMLSSRAEHVYGIEIVEESVNSAVEFHKKLGINNTNIIAGDCADVLPKIIEETANSLIVLDPPRTGCDEKVVRAVNGSNAENVIYVSCNPSTLARDISRMENYSVKEIVAFDMFPQTCHVETVCLLTLKNQK